MLSQISEVLTFILRINEPISGIWTFWNAFLMVITNMDMKIQNVDGFFKCCEVLDLSFAHARCMVTCGIDPN